MDVISKAYQPRTSDQRPA